jgi:AmmeMemoRadiSam system protein B
MKTAAPEVRAPAVAGLFYPGDPMQLNATLDSLLRSRKPAGHQPKALIVPHAGYVYSGPIAATAYGLIDPTVGNLRRAVIVGPSHRQWFRGAALPASTAFATPLGEVRVDVEAVNAIRTLPHVLICDEPHAAEHSLEVQLPFLQRIDPSLLIVPVLVGDATVSEVEAIIDALWGGPETLILVSSDLSHYHSYEGARAIDARTAQDIVAGQGGLQGEQACGCVGVNALIRAAAKRGLRAELLDLRNSGDTAGDRRRVVGYGAFAIHEH